MTRRYLLVMPGPDSDHNKIIAMMVKHNKLCQYLLPHNSGQVTTNKDQQIKLEEELFEFRKKLQFSGHFLID